MGFIAMRVCEYRGVAVALLWQFTGWNLLPRLESEVGELLVSIEGKSVRVHNRYQRHLEATDPKGWDEAVRVLTKGRNIVAVLYLISREGE
jgi:hypothetical protein